MADLFNFQDWLDKLDTLTDGQREELLFRLSGKDTITNRIANEKGLLTADNGGVIACPHCGSVNVIKYGHSNGKQKYRCKEKECSKIFRAETKTIFENTRLEIWQWKEILRGMVEGLSIPTIANNIGVSTKAVWYNKNKVMQLISSEQGTQDSFNSITECDETEVHLHYKGKRSPEFFIKRLDRMPRHHRSRLEKIEYLKKAGLLWELEKDPEHLEALLTGDKYLAGTKNDSVCVLTATDRNNGIYIKPTCVGSLESNHVVKHFDGRLTNDSIIVTDGNTTYNWFAEERNLHHEVVLSKDHVNGPFSLAHVNALHSTFSMYYAEHRRNLPATKYLDLGVDFFWWLQKNKQLTTQQKVKLLFDMLLEKPFDITYNELIHRKLTLDTKALIPDQL